MNLTPTSHYQNIDKVTDIESISVWDVHGNIIASTNRELLGMKMPLEYIQKVYEQGTYFRGLERDPLTGKILLTHLEEVRNWQSGVIVGAISLNIRGKILDDVTGDRDGLGTSGETYLVDKNYRMITQSRFVPNSILRTQVNTAGTRACFTGPRQPGGRAGKLSHTAVALPGKIHPLRPHDPTGRL